MNVKIILRTNYNIVIVYNKFVQCELCESNLNNFPLFPYAVFLDLYARIVRHTGNFCLTRKRSLIPWTLNSMPGGQRILFGHGVPIKTRIRKGTCKACSGSMCTASVGDGSDRDWIWKSGGPLLLKTRPLSVVFTTESLLVVRSSRPCEAPIVFARADWWRDLIASFHWLWLDYFNLVTFTSLMNSTQKARGQQKFKGHIRPSTLNSLTRGLSDRNGLLT